MTVSQPVSDGPSPGRRISLDQKWLTDFELVELVRGGDIDAFAVIIRRNNKRLYRLARSVVRNDSEAEDVVQETYVRAYAKLDDFVGPSGFASWIARIAFHEALARLRSHRRIVLVDDPLAITRRPGAGGGPQWMLSADPDPERLAASAELRTILEAAIDALPDEFRTVFVLRAIEGFSVAETSDTLGVAAETVKTRYHRARRRLRDSLRIYAALGETIDRLYAFGGERCRRTVAGTMARVALTSSRSTASEPPVSHAAP